jgi:hypothetical protein
MGSFLNMEKGSRLICVRQFSVTGGQQIKARLLANGIMPVALNMGRAFRLIWSKLFDPSEGPEIHRSMGQYLCFLM